MQSPIKWKLNAPIFRRCFVCVQGILLGRYVIFLKLVVTLLVVFFSSSLKCFLVEQMDKMNMKMNKI